MASASDDVGSGLEMVSRMTTNLLRVAVVDDDHRILESLNELLAAAGYEVALFASGAEFLAADCMLDIVCLISDIEMPLMDGWELVRMARLRRADLPIILITGHERVQATSLQQHSDYRFFRKPFDGSDLLRALASLVAAHS